MNCTCHIKNAITSICIAPHKCECQRKLCIDCLYDHDVEIKKHTVSIKIFTEKVIQKFKENKHDESSELTKQRTSLKSLLSLTESMLKKILEDLSNSIQQIYDMIEMEDKSYLKIISDNINPAELSNSDLEKLVQIVEGQQLIDWNAKKNSYLQKLERTQKLWDQEVKAFNEKLEKEIKEIQSLIKAQQSQQEDYVYERKEDLYEILASLKDVDASIFNVIIKVLKVQKISDIQGFLQKADTQKHLDINNQERQKIINAIRNINEHDFNRNDHSTEAYREVKQDLIKNIQQDQKIIKFLQFLISLSALDQKFIQSGTNALNLLVKMGVDLGCQCFENIKIQNTSLVGANFVRCNFMGSEFENVQSKLQYLLFFNIITHYKFFIEGKILRIKLVTLTKFQQCYCVDTISFQKYPYSFNQYQGSSLRYISF